MPDELSSNAIVPRLVVLISGRGSNLEALIQAAQAETLGGEIVAVISNRSDAPGLKIAQSHQIPTLTLESGTHPDRKAFDQALITMIERQQPDLVVLAGFMRILSADFVNYFYGRLLNIHPSLLPALPGLHTHRHAITQGLKQHGCTVHFVTHLVDSGPIIAQADVPVYPDDTEDSLAQRVLHEEHLLYPLIVRWFLEGRLQLINNQVQLDGQILPAQGLRLPYQKPDF